MGAGGLHHVTAITSEASRSLDFYTGVLGLRLVKKTVSHQDPGSYHLYFGDELGRPGTIFSIFVWSGSTPGRCGKAEAEQVALRIPVGSLDWWRARLDRAGVRTSETPLWSDMACLGFRDPDGVPLALAEWPDCKVASALPGAISEHAIRGLHGAALAVADVAPIAVILMDLFGFRGLQRRQEGMLLEHPSDIGNVISLRAAGHEARGRLGCGTIAHVALRVPDADDLDRIALHLRSEYRIPSIGPKDRAYYRSVYFREPGGLLLEAATDGPGFIVDEPADGLGSALRLPRHLEGRRGELERILPRLP